MARQIIESALKKIGVLDPAETMSPEDADDGLETLNDLIDEWNATRLYLYTTVMVVASWSGATATIGVGGTLNTPRPFELEDGASFYRLGNIDYGIKNATLEQYNSISIKSTGTQYPDWIYYDGGFPLGNVFVYPVPASPIEYHIALRQQLTAFADLDTDYPLPPGYKRALTYSMAEEMAPLHSREPSATVVRIAMNSRRSLRKTNVEVPLLTLDTDTTGDGSRINILSNR